MRIPGLATGMDTDSMVKEMMKPYQMKVDRVKQDNLRIKYQQDIYRDVLKQSQDFYNKYFSVSSKDSLMSSSNWQTVGFNSSNEGAVTASGTAGAKIDNYKINVKQLAKEAAVTADKTKFFDGSGKLVNDTLTIKVNGKEIKDIDLKGATSLKDISDKINERLKTEKVEASAQYSQFADGIVLTTNNMGEKQKISMTVGGETLNGIGSNALVEMKNSRGETHEFKGETNSVVLDGINFKFNDTTTNEVSLTGKNDVKKTKDMIINFVNDYNKLIENMNKQLITKHDRSYSPLTDEQRKDMSEDQQKLWDKKAKEGLLKGDMNLNRINDKLKGIMRTNFGGMNLEKIGIIPVNNYGEQNGMFTIDEFKLEEALEKNPGEVKDLFLRQPVDDKDPSTGGILSKMKDTLYNETVSVSAPLMKKAGMEGSVTAFNNELTTTMEKKQKIIAEMERDLATRENNYYLQFSRLETQMNRLNGQNAYLMAQLGGGK